MQLTAKSRYAVRIMVHLAVHGSHSPVRRDAIARAEGMSRDYAEQILIKLKGHGLVRSERGTTGGFLLARPPAQVTVAAVVEAMEGSLALAPCRSRPCKRAGRCVVLPVWQEATSALERSLAAHTIAELAGRARELEASKSESFEI
jgi:Rrf2 family protein